MPTDTALNVLQRWLTNGPTARITLVSAWGKASALSLLEAPASSFRASGGRLDIFLGLSQGGATEQGLRLALRLANETHVVFDPTGRTFHPKLYLRRDEDHFAALIGSQNLTAAGLQTNYEAGVLIEGRLSSREDAKVLLQLEGFIGTLRDDSGICKRLDDQLLQDIIDDPTIPLGSEANSENGPVSERDGNSTKLFGASVMQLTYGKRTRRPTGNVTSPAEAPTGENFRATYEVLPTTSAFWSKRLPRADAMRLPTANPTAHLALTQSGYPIDPSVYFRNEFFADCEWIPTLEGTRHRDEAHVPFVISGLFATDRIVQLQVDHTPSWQSSQGNRATSIRWGELFHTLRYEVDVSGTVLVMERTAQNTFKITFTRDFN